MKAKIYNKKKLFSLLILPFVAGNITAKSTLAADTVYNPAVGETVHVSGTNDSYRIFTYNEEVTVILDAAAQLNNDDNYAAVHLGPNATVDMKVGSEITSTNIAGEASGVEFNNKYSDYGAINQVTMDQAAISATATAGSAAGIYSGWSDNYWWNGYSYSSSSNVTTQISLDNNSSITATATGAASKYAAGIYLSYGDDNSSVIELDHGSSITASATVTPTVNNSATAGAQGIHIYNQEDTLIILDNSSKIEATATATATGTGTASVDYTYGIYAESENFGDSVVSMNNGSSVTGTATATATIYAAIRENSGIQLSNDNYGNASVTMANNSAITNISTATATGADGGEGAARVEDSYGIYAHSNYGNSSVSLDSGSTITISATATNHNLGSSTDDQAHATDIYGIYAHSYYGDSTVTLNNLSSVSASSKATAQDRASANAVGIYAEAYGYGDNAYGDATVTVRGASTVTAAAEAATTPGAESAWNGARADAQGIYAYTDYGNASVILDNSSATSTAEATITTAAAVTSAGSYADANAYGIYAGSDQDGRSLVDLRNGGAVTATATASNDSSAGAKYSNNNDAWADAYGIEAYSNYGLVDVNLDSGAVTIQADATAKGNADSYDNDAWASASGIGAEGYSGRVNVDLDSSTVKADATATGDGWAGAEGIGIEAWNNWWNGSNTAATTVTLDGSTVEAIAAATATGAGYDSYANADADATGIYAQTNGYIHDAKVTITNLSQVTAEATATTAAGVARADTYGIYAESYYTDTNITVSLNSSVSATATATSTSTAAGISDAYANATGIYADGAEGAAVSLTDSTLTAGATAITAGASDAGAFAYGIDLNADNTTATVTLDSATITATAVATASMSGAPVVPDAVVPAVAYSGSADAGAYGIAVDSYGESNTVNLTDSQISATATATGYYAEADGVGVLVDGNQSYYNTNTITLTLDNADITTAATTTAAAGYYGGNANADAIDLYGAADIAVDLSYASSLTATATGTNTVGSMDVYAGGIAADAESRGYDLFYPDAESTVTLNSATVTATATATAGYDASAEAGGISSQANARSFGGYNTYYGPYPDYTPYTTYYNSDANANSSVNLTSATLTVKATATGTDQADAWSQGIDSSSDAGSESYYPSYASSGNTVTLDSTKIDSQAKATGVNRANAYAGGIDAWNRADADSYDYTAYAASNISVSLSNNSSVTAIATASASADGGNAYARAIGIRADANAYADAYYSSYGYYGGGEGYANLSVSLDNATVNASGTATGDGGEGSATAIRAYAEADSYGDDTYAWSGSAVDIALTNTTLGATASFTGDYGTARATGLYTHSSANSRSYYDDADAWSESTITLAAVTISAGATSTGNYASAYADGITADDQAYGGLWTYYSGDGDASSSVNLTADTATVSVTATATGLYADATAAGITVGSDAEADSYDIWANASSAGNITLDAASVNVTAAATGAYSDASAYGISADSRADAFAGSYYWADASSSASVTLTSSSVRATATADGAEGMAQARGISADAYSEADDWNDYSSASADASINLTDSSVTADATANGTYGNAVAYGMRASASTDYGSYDYSSAANASITLTDSSVTSTATANGTYGQAVAYGMRTGADTDYVSYDYYSATDASVNLTNSSVTASAVADGAYGQASAVGVLAESQAYSSDYSSHSISINLTDSTINASASAQGEYGSASAGGIGADGSGYDDITISLDNAAVSATATGGGLYGSGYAVGVAAATADNITINLANSSSIDATASGDDRIILEGRRRGSYAAGIMLYDAYTATVNIDATSSVSGGDYAILAQNVYHAAVNNYGLIAGRVNVTDLNNLTDLDDNTGTLRATLAENDNEWVSDPELPYDGPFYFAASASATLADGSTFQIATSDDLGFTALGQVKEYRLLGTDTAGGDWDPAMLNIVKYGYQSPLLQFSYSDPADVETPGLSDDDHYILRVKLLTPTEAGLTPNAGAAALAALADGNFDLFNSNPEEWSPEIMSKVFGTMQFMHGNLYNIENRLHGKKSGESSGDPAANNHLWVDANYTDATQDMRDNIEGFDTETMAFNLGYDRNLSANALLGLSFGYGNTEAETELSHRTLDMDAYMLSLYGQFKGQGWFGEGQLSAGWGSIDSLRNVGATAYTASYDSNSYYAKIAGGMSIDAGSWAVMPKASLDYASISFDDYVEAGGTMALTVSSDTYDSSNIGAGLSVMNKGRIITPEIGAMVYYDLIGDTIQTSSRFNGGTNYFKTEGADPARTSWELNAGLTFEAPGTPITFKVGYDLLGREDFISHNFNGKLTFDF